LDLNQVKVAVDSSIWVEKYKPTCIEDVLIEPSLKLKFQEYIKNKDIQNILLQGLPGNGKTSCAKLLARAITDDVLFINASSENGIDTVRHKIEPFCVCQSMSDSKIKIVILDEMEMSSENFQTALREIIERFYSTTRFILTCNFINKVIEPLKSRTQEYRFGNISQKEILKRCFCILDRENVKYEQKDVAKVVKSLGTDMRRIINALQRLTVEQDGVLTLMQYITTEEKMSKLLEFFKAKKLTEFRKFVGEQKIPVEEVSSFLFNKAFEKQISEKNWKAIMGVFGLCNDTMRIAVDPEITLTHHVLTAMGLVE
jgi:replication factor C small subunit